MVLKRSLEMEQFNYHKLINLKKKLEKYNDIISAELIEVVDKHIILQKQISKHKDIERHELSE